MSSPYSSCTLCPRNCQVDRTGSETGYCGQSDQIVISTATLHFGEEPPIAGEGGSGTIFFSGCTLRCPFCQNWQVSCGLTGSEITIDLLIEIMLKLQNKGAENINFVTGTHLLPSIKEAVTKAQLRGLIIPLVWNCSGYETLETIDELNTFIDIYIPDYKTSDSNLAERLFQASDYPKIAEHSILKMVENRVLEFTEDGKMKKGVIIRHLALPGELESSRRFFKWYSENLKGKAIISVMIQYTPVKIPWNTVRIPDRQISQQEYEKLLDYMDEYEIEEGFFQDLETGNDWLPDFNKIQPFPSKQTKVIWSSVVGDFV